MAFCNKCGASNPPGSTFCYKCGSKLINEDYRPDPIKDQKADLTSRLRTAEPIDPLTKRSHDLAKAKVPERNSMPVQGPQQKAPVQQRQLTPEEMIKRKELMRRKQLMEAQKRRSKVRKLKIVSTAVSAIIIIAAIVIVFNGSGKSQLLTQSIQDGDYILYSVNGTGSSGASNNGTVNLTFSNVTATNCTLTWISTTNGFANSSGTYSYNTTNGKFLCQGLIGNVLDNSTNYVQTAALSTPLGNMTADQYMYIVSSGGSPGMCYTYYIENGTWIPLVIEKIPLEALTPSANVSTLKIESTNISWV